MLKDFKYRLYPAKQKAELINKRFGNCRFVYNLALEVKKDACPIQRKNLSRYDLISHLPELKKECEWLNEVESQALQQSIVNLDKTVTVFGMKAKTSWKRD